MVLGAVSLSFTTSFAATWSESCPDLKACADVMHETLGQNYAFSPEAVDAKLHFSNHFEIQKENAELIFTSALYDAGLSRVHLTGDAYKIVKLSEARSENLPIIKASETEAPTLPNNYDLSTLSYSFTNKAAAKYAENAIRSFVNILSRVWGSQDTGVIFVTDNNKNLARAYQILKTQDVATVKQAKKQ